MGKRNREESEAGGVGLGLGLVGIGGVCKEGLKVEGGWTGRHTDDTTII